MSSFYREFQRKFAELIGLRSDQYAAFTLLNDAVAD
jgi:hypothetical protein